MGKNKVDLGKGDKALWVEIEMALANVLEELRKKDKLRLHYTDEEKAHIYLMQENVYSISRNYNSLLDMTLTFVKEPEETKDLQKALTQFGFGDRSTYYLHIQIDVLNCILHVETAKAYFLYHLKDIENYKPSYFSVIMSRNAPDSWRRLNPYVDNDFRNSLAHGTWSIVNNKILLFKDARLHSPERLEIFEFIKKVKSQNILYSVIVNLIPEKFREYFNKY